MLQTIKNILLPPDPDLYYGGHYGSFSYWRLFLWNLRQWRGVFINMKFRSNLPLKYTINRKNFRLRRAETMKRGGRLFLEICTQWRGVRLFI